MNRILGLDIVRTIAIMQVTLVHSTYIFPTLIKDSFLRAIPAIDGVSIFFVLSGFLIGGILLKITEKDHFTLKDLTQFWIRRWFRTLPNYLLILILLFLYDIFIYKIQSSVSIRYLFFTQNFISNHPDFFPEAWSLSVEEWFYLLYPLCCYLGFKIFTFKRNAILFSALGFISIPFLLRVFAYINLFEFHELVIRKIVIFRLDSLMYGVIGSYLFRYHSKFWGQIQYYGVFLSFLLILILSISNQFTRNSSMFWQVYIFNIEALATLMAIPFFSGLIKTKYKKTEKVITFISTISYSMYLLNLSIIEWRIIPAFLSITNLKLLNSEYMMCISYLLFWPILIGSSWLLYRFYELPIMNLRDKISIGIKN